MTGMRPEWRARRRASCASSDAHAASGMKSRRICELSGSGERVECVEGLKRASGVSGSWLERTGGGDGADEGRKGRARLFAT